LLEVLAGEGVPDASGTQDDFGGLGGGHADLLSCHDTDSLWNSRLWICSELRYGSECLYTH
jgi:hypothetical protein